MAGGEITRCVCTDRTFLNLKAEGAKTLDQLAEITGAGTRCGLCRPYLGAMFATGRTEFDADEDVSGLAGEISRTDAEPR